MTHGDVWLGSPWSWRWSVSAEMMVVCICIPLCGTGIGPEALGTLMLARVAVWLCGLRRWGGHAGDTAPTQYRCDDAAGND